MFRKTFIKIAFLNLKRRLARSVLTISMIALSLIGVMSLSGLYDGMVVQMIDATLRGDSGEILIAKKGFREDEQLRYTIENPEVIRSQLDAHTDIKSYVERIKLGGLIATAGYSQNVTIQGVDIAKELKQSGFENYIDDGEYNFGKRGNGAIVGRAVAQKLKLTIGKKVVLTMQDRNGEVVSGAYKVTGIISSPFMQNGILVDITKLQETLGLGSAISEFCIVVNERAKSGAIKATIASALPSGVVAFDWTELYSSLKDMESMMVIYSAFMYGFVFLVSSIGIFGVVLVSVLERIREFGIMMAIGTRFADVAKMIVLESLFLSLIGYLVGAVVGGLILLYLSIYGLDFSSLSDAFLMFGMDSNMKAAIRINYFTDSLIAIVIATLLAVILPIRTLKKRKPIEAIKERA